MCRDVTAAPRLIGPMAAHFRRSGRSAAASLTDSLCCSLHRGSWHGAHINDACACVRQERQFVGRGVSAKVAAAAASAWLELARVDETSLFDYAPLVHRAALVYRPAWALECYQLLCVARMLQRVRQRARRQREQALALAAAHRTSALLRAAMLSWRHAIAQRCAARCQDELPECAA